MPKKDSDVSAMRHSAAHLLAAAVQNLWPDVKLGVGPVIEDGFYYDFDLEHRISEDDFTMIEAKMQELAAKGLGYEREDVPIADAKLRCDKMRQPYKKELVELIEQTGSTDLIDDEDNKNQKFEGKIDSVSFYTTGDFLDLCRGGHVTNTTEIGPFKLLKVAGAYWRGNEDNPMLQRIYGTCWPNQAELDAYLSRLEEAKQRDHRKIGKELDLFTFSDLVGAGLPLWTPKGTVLRTQLFNRLMQISHKYDVSPVTIPHMAKRVLYETSGHAEKFSDELFTVTSHYNQEFVLKPVNCPHHTQIYAARPRSYRDLPLRFMESTMQYRDEKPGEIGGLTRVRSITVDDGHIFCRVDQIRQEAGMIADIIREFYESFDMYGNHWVSLSVRDPQTPEKYIGDDAGWVQAETMLAEISDQKKLHAKRMEGEAALYGPKLDYMFKDSLGREWQLATIQIDFAMPKRFGLTYTNAEGQPESPVMIHRAILGSYERFLAILIEHYAGKFPLWLAPVQVKVLTIADRHFDYADKVTKELKAAGMRVELDASSESVGKKIRAGQLEKVPYMLIVGDKEVESQEVAIRSRDAGDLGVLSQKAFLDKLRGESQLNLDD